MIRLVIALLVVALPALAQQASQRSAPPARSTQGAPQSQPVEPIWGRDGINLLNAFNAAAERARYRWRAGPMFCTVQPVMPCEFDADGILIRFRATERPEAVREVSLVTAPQMRMAYAAAAVAILTEIAEPHLTPAQRHEAVQALLGFNGQRPVRSVEVGQTRIFLREAWRQPMEIVLQPKSDP